LKYKYNIVVHLNPSVVDGELREEEAYQVT